MNGRITAHQLNRAAASAIDAALMSNKEDLARFIGRGNVGSSYFQIWELKPLLTAGKAC